MGVRRIPPPGLRFPGQDQVHHQHLLPPVDPVRGSSARLRLTVVQKQDRGWSPAPSGDSLPPESGCNESVAEMDSIGIRFHSPVLGVVEHPRTLDCHRLETHQRSKSCPAVLEVFDRPTFLRVRFPQLPVGQLARHAQDGEVVLRETDHQILIALDLPIDGILMVPIPEAEMSGQTPVGLKPVVQLIVVDRGVRVFVPVQMVSFAEEAKEGLDVVVDVGPDQGSPEAAFVLGVVDQQSRLGCPHGRRGRAREEGTVTFSAPSLRPFGGGWRSSFGPRFRATRG